MEWSRKCCQVKILCKTKCRNLTVVDENLRGKYKRTLTTGGGGLVQSSKLNIIMADSSNQRNEATNGGQIAMELNCLKGDWGIPSVDRKCLNILV